MSGRCLPAVVLATVAALGACTGGSPAHPSTGSATQTTAGVDALPWWEHSAVCQLNPSASLTSTLATRWAPPASAGVHGLAAHSPVSKEGWLFAEERGSGFNGASMWNVKSGEHRTIRQFKDPTSYQAAGGFDGRHVLWVETHRLENFDDFSVFAYDLTSGTSRHLGDNESDRAGNPYPSPIDAPVAQDGVGAWIQGSGKDGQRTLKVADLTTGKVRNGYTGFVNGVSFVGGDLLVVMGDWTRRLLDPRTLEDKTLPAGVSQYDGRTFVSFGDDGSVVYANEGPDEAAPLTELWYSPKVSEPARMVLRLPADHGLQSPPSVTATGIVYATQGSGSFYLDRKTGNAVRITDSQSYFVADDTVVTLDASADKSAPPTSVRVFTLPSSIMVGCSKRSAQPRSTKPQTVHTSSTASVD